MIIVSYFLFARRLDTICRMIKIESEYLILSSAIRLIMDSRKVYVIDQTHQVFGGITFRAVTFNGFASINSWCEEHIDNVLQLASNSLGTIRKINLIGKDRADVLEVKVKIVKIDSTIPPVINGRANVERSHIIIAYTKCLSHPSGVVIRDY